MLRLRFLTALLLFMTVATSTVPAHATGDGPDRYRITSLWNDAGGGNVLRPDRGTDSFWWLGLDAGVTYSTFMNGPMTFYMPNPYNPRYTLPTSVDDGNGLGFYLGLTVDLPLSDIVGIVLKGNYHTRMGSFEETTDMLEVHPQTSTNLTTILSNKTDWTFNYIGLDLLGRINLGSAPVYLLVGPSFGFLSSNKAKLDQAIIQPDDIYYTEDVNGSDEVVNEFQTASIEEEVIGIKSSRIDLKFGLGFWIELNEDLYLTPEITLSYPLTTLVEEEFLDANREFTFDERAAIRPWYGGELEALVLPNKDFNMMTATFTVGLRWRMK